MPMSLEKKRLWRQRPEVKARQRENEKRYRERHAERVKQARKPRDKRRDAKVSQTVNDLRRAAIIAMGGRCIRWGFDIEDALQIDHKAPIGQPKRGLKANRTLFFHTLVGEEAPGETPP